MKCVLLAILIACSVALAGEPASYKTETNRLPYLGVEAGSGYHELYLAQPVSEKVQIHGLLYRTKPDDHPYETLGFIGASYRLFQYKGGELSFGAGAYGGTHQATTAALMGEALLERKWLKGEGVIIHGLRRPEERHAPRDTYLVWYLGPQFPCWGKSHEGRATCEAGFAQDNISHNGDKENLKGFRLAVPVPKLRYTKGYVKFLSHGTVLWGMEFRP